MLYRQSVDWAVTPRDGSPSFFFWMAALYRRHVVAYAFTRRLLNAPAAFIHPCQPIVAKQPPTGPGWGARTEA
jgi:hypothetical protein